MTAAAGEAVAYDAVPGLVERRDRHGETTLVVEPARLVDACVHLRDEEGFNVLADVAGADYLGWGSAGVSGYIGTAVGAVSPGRDLNAPMTQGYQRLPAPKPKRFSMSYHLLAVSERPRRVRVRVLHGAGGERELVELDVPPGVEREERARAEGAVARRQHLAVRDPEHGGAAAVAGADERRDRHPQGARDPPHHVDRRRALVELDLREHRPADVRL